MNLTQKTSKGFMAIITVIALLAFSTSIMFATSYLSIGQSQAGLAVTQGEAALQLAHGCSENVLLLTRRDETYSGGTINTLDGTCDITIEKDTTPWKFTIIGEKAGFERTIIIFAERLSGSPATLTVTSWLEE